MSTNRSALLVAAGILLSRVIGLIRQRIFLHYFGGISDAADAFTAAFRIPNFLQNLFGEGALSASFIPVYARLLAHGDEREANRVAGAIFALLALVTSLLVLLGVFATPVLIDVIAPGFAGESELTIGLVRVLFPGAGLLVLSAWCLGILNSHKRFFLSYAAPVVWNVAMIATLFTFGGQIEQYQLAMALAWGSVLGSALQFMVQLPTVLKLARGLRLSLGRNSLEVRAVLRNFVPAFVGRGVVQISAYVDSMIASLLGTGAVNSLAAARFSNSFRSAFSECRSRPPNCRQWQRHRRSRRSGDLSARSLKRQFAQSGVLDCAIDGGFRNLGDVVTTALYQSGRFTRDETIYVWLILAGYSAGLLASTLGRLYSSTYYALQDTRTPLRFAIVRVALATALGYSLAVALPPALGLTSYWGVFGLTISAALAGWVEFLLLRRKLNARIGQTGLALSFSAKLWLSALTSAGIGWMIKLAVGALHPVLLAIIVLLPYGLLYFALTAALKVLEAQESINKIKRTVMRRVSSTPKN
ncbi:MAG: murein biosynthesis integral membrane protein MurJ [Pyrinomonadaceae bacterium]